MIFPEVRKIPPLICPQCKSTKCTKSYSGIVCYACSNITFRNGRKRLLVDVDDDEETKPRPRYSPEDYYDLP